MFEPLLARVHIKYGCRTFTLLGVTLKMSTRSKGYVEVGGREHYKTLARLTHVPSVSAPAGAVGIVESSLVPSLVLKLKTELDDIQELILDTLSGCLRVEAFEALASGGVHILKEKLIHESVAIRSKAARALLGISVPLEGKNIVWEEEVIPELFNLLEDADDQVRANAAGALMNAAITTQGKYAALGANAIPCLLNLINDETSKVRLNSVKALTMLAEAPEGRKTLLSHVDQFKERMNDSSEAVSRAASIAVRVIEWKP
uniref:Radial spoke head 14 homolog n=1 Tax=Sphenodon punctatus TaxID=8508 RepID=A0A8D0HGU6_SPHPU